MKYEVHQGVKQLRALRLQCSRQQVCAVCDME
jgi:hypothetical protein